MRLLFAKHSLAWPRSSGHDLRTYHLMRACGALGHEVCLATVTEPSVQALDGLCLRQRFRLDNAPDGAEVTARASWAQRRFRSFWGVSDAQIAALRRAADSCKPDVVVIAGLDALPYFPALSGVVRVWYAADEWVLHHLSMLRLRDGALRENLRAAAIKGLYERVHRHVVDRVWVVSESDRRAMRWVAGMPRVDVLANGVDGEFFRPGDETPGDRTAVFWGRLDFGPNIQAMEWFCRKVWPIVRRNVSDARLTIIGFHPTDAVRELAGGDGITLEADLQDLRDTARRHAVAVLPMVSGAGIKNKLLEGAALGLPIVCTPEASRGLLGDPPLVTASRPSDYAQALISLWSDPLRRRDLAAATRAWVLQHHTWSATARAAVASLEKSALKGVAQ